MPQNPNHTAVPKKSVTFVMTEKGYFAMKITDYAKLTAFLTWYVTGPRDDVGKFINDFKHKKSIILILCQHMMNWLQASYVL